VTGLPTPTSVSGRAGLEALLTDPLQALLASDYDGTLAPIVDDPTRAYPQPGAVEALARLAEVVGGVAVVTGRPAATAVDLGGLRSVPGLYVLGAYGAQRWHEGHESQLVQGPQQPVAVAVRDAVRDVVDRLAPPGTAIEVKGPAVAVHVRECPDPAEAQARLSRPLVGVAETYGLTVEPGRMVIELRPSGIDKGQALRALVEELGSGTVVFIGDDLGDLAAFGAVNALRDTGRTGLTVASASAEAPEVAAAADLVVDGPAGVVDLLRELAAALTG
jgi:trehalose 6-phosphate phosphatase